MSTFLWFDCFSLASRENGPEVQGEGKVVAVVHVKVCACLHVCVCVHVCANVRFTLPQSETLWRRWLYGFPVGKDDLTKQANL